MNKKAFYTTPQIKALVLKAKRQLLVSSVGIGGTYSSSVNGEVRARGFDFDEDDDDD